MTKILRGFGFAIAGVVGGFALVSLGLVLDQYVGPWTWETATPWIEEQLG